MPDDPIDYKDATFGDAQDRRTHVPIKFKNLPKGEEGRFGPTLLQALLNTPALLTGKSIGQLPNKGEITLNPNSPSFNFDRDARHEATHSALASMPDSGLTVSPLYSRIAQQLAKNRIMQNPAQETAAYMTAYDPKQSQVPQDWRDQYMDQLKQSLAIMNPSLAKQVGLLSQSPQDLQGASQ